jgi:diadenylate cyclase
MLELRDLLDIVLVSVVMYQMLLILKGTRAIQILFGLLLVFGISLASQGFGLITLSWVLDHFFTYLVLIIVILFQDEIRTALTSMGRFPLLGRQNILDADRVEDILRAAYEMSAQRTGALIVIERDDALGTYIRSGTAMDGLISKELLVGIFQVANPLHDGAVILRGKRIAAAGCFLPLAMDDALPRNWGTRHRAALGIARESDCVVLVVSEESGRVSLVVRDEFKEGLELKEMRGELQRYVGEQRMQREGVE